MLPHLEQLGHAFHPELAKGRKVEVADDPTRRCLAYEAGVRLGQHLHALGRRRPLTGHARAREGPVP